MSEGYAYEYEYDELEKRALGIAQTIFPYEPRKGQKEKVEQVVKRIIRGRTIILELPTGTGKTVISVVSSISVAKALGKRVLFLTSKVDQGQRFIDEIRAINTHLMEIGEAGLTITATQLTSIDRLCVNTQVMDYALQNPNDSSKITKKRKVSTGDLVFHRNNFDKKKAEVLRKREEIKKRNKYHSLRFYCSKARSKSKCPFANRVSKNLKGERIDDLVYDLVVIDRDTADSYGMKKNYCPHILTSRASLKTEAIVMAYPYVFDPQIIDKTMTKLGIDSLNDLEDFIIVVDEAHNLPSFISNAQKIKIDNSKALKATKYVGNIVSQMVNNFSRYSWSGNKKEPDYSQLPVRLDQENMATYYSERMEEVAEIVSSSMEVKEAIEELENNGVTPLTSKIPVFLPVIETTYGTILHSGKCPYCGEQLTEDRFTTSYLEIFEHCYENIEDMGHLEPNNVLAFIEYVSDITRKGETNAEDTKTYIINSIVSDLEKYVYLLADKHNNNVRKAFLTVKNDQKKAVSLLNTAIKQYATIKILAKLLNSLWFTKKIRIENTYIPPKNNTKATIEDYFDLDVEAKNSTNAQQSKTNNKTKMFVKVIVENIGGRHPHNSLHGEAINETERFNYSAEQLFEDYLMIVMGEIYELEEWYDTQVGGDNEDEPLAPYKTIAGYMVSSKTTDKYETVVETYFVEKEKRSSFVFQYFDVTYGAQPLRKTFANILMSATMYPPQYYADVLGVRNHGKQDYLKGEQVFSTKNRGVIVVPIPVNGAMEKMKPSIEKLKRYFYYLSKTPVKNIFAFFRSYSMMYGVLDKETSEKITSTGREIIKTNNRSSPEDITRQVKNPNKKFLVVSVQGGKLSEGVEFIDPQNKVSLVDVNAIVSMQYTPPSQINNKWYEYFKTIYGRKAYNYFYTIPAINKLIQSIGRAHRSETDKAIIVVFDERLLRGSVNWLLPEFIKKDWEIAKTPEELERKIIKIAKQLWE